MKLLSIVLSIFAANLYLSGQLRLTYHHDETTYVVHGFDLSRPFSEENGKKTYLPLEGSWGLEIEDESFWENCLYPRFYKIGRKREIYSGKGDQLPWFRSRSMGGRLL